MNSMIYFVPFTLLVILSILGLVKNKLVKNKVDDIFKRVKFIDEETSNTSLALIKLEDMAYKEHEERAMP